MRFTDWIIIFLIIFSCFTVVSFYQVNSENKAGIADTQYANTIAVACHDAAKTIPSENADTGCVWAHKEDRDHTLDTFYKTLRYCFNSEYTTKGDETCIYTPVACLIDNDGYYISFNSAFDDYGNTYWASSGNASSRMYYDTITTSTLNAWSKAYGDITVRFYLDDTVEITFPNGFSIKDSRRELPELLNDNADKGNFNRTYLQQLLVKDVNGVSHYTLSQFLNNENNIFDIEKSELIIRRINEEVEFYINHHNLWAEQTDIPYQFTMPEISGEDWHRLLEHPTIISFLQGVQLYTHQRLYNVYALGGGEYIPEEQYYITEGPHYINGKPDYKYHLLGGNCPYNTVEYVNRNGVVYRMESLNNKQKILKDGYYTCNGTKIERLYTSMGECAAVGAYPCECAINLN